MSTLKETKPWASYYAKLAGVAVWRGFTFFLYTLVGAGGAALVKVVDLRTLTMKDAGWVLAGTILTSIAGAWYKNPPPDPAPPTP